MTAKIYITSYDLATHHIKDFILRNIQLVIADEGHHLKSFESKRCKILKPYLQERKHIFILTGTPALARPKEIFNLLSIIRPDAFS